MELERFVSFSCVFFEAFWLDPGEGCENMRAAAPACSLARALRALAGDSSWERLGRIALLEKASEILPKSLPEASRDFPELKLTLALLGLILGLLGIILGLLGSWGLQNPPKSLPEALPEAPELNIRSFLGVMLAPFWDKKQGFRMESVAFLKSEGFENN